QSVPCPKGGEHEFALDDEGDNVCAKCLEPGSKAKGRMPTTKGNAPKNGDQVLVACPATCSKRGARPTRSGRQPRRRASGQRTVRLNGCAHDLGKHASPALNASGRKAPRQRTETADVRPPTS